MLSIDREFMAISNSMLGNWRKTYNLTWQIWDMEPWTMLSRMALIGVEQPETGELGFLSVTDDLSFPSISIYRNARGLVGFYYSHNMPLPDYPEQYLEIPQIKIDFKEYDALPVEDQSLISQLGITHEHEHYPIFRSVQPGYRPWFLEDDEVNFLLCVLEQALDVLPRAFINIGILQPKPGNRFPVRAQNIVTKTWHDTHISIPQPGSEPILFMMDKPLLEKVKHLPHSPIEVEIDFFLVTGVPVSDADASKRPRYPYMFLTVDASLGLILGHELLSPSPTVESMWGLIGWKLVSQFDKLGVIPKTVLVRSPVLVQVLASFTQMLGFKLKEIKSLPGVDAAKLILDHLNDHLD